MEKQSATITLPVWAACAFCAISLASSTAIGEYGQQRYDAAIRNQDQYVADHRINRPTLCEPAYAFDSLTGEATNNRTGTRCIHLTEKEARRYFGSVNQKRGS